MDRETFILKLSLLKNDLVEELGVDEVTDYARERAYYCLVEALQILRENEE